MNYWLAIVGSKASYLRFVEEQDFWFCLPKDCCIGDKVITYSSKKAAGSNSGVFGFFEIELKDVERDCQCRQYGLLSGTGERLVYVNLRKIKLLPTPIPFNKIKTTNALSHSAYVRRNMQATYFDISSNEYKIFNSLT
jgi:predicted RNA-binding protein with PUA-like domain